MTRNSVVIKRGYGVSMDDSCKIFRLLIQLPELIDILFPVFAVELFDPNGLDRAFIKAPCIDTETFRMRAGDVKGLDAAGLAEQMLCFVGIEGVEGQVFLT